MVYHYGTFVSKKGVTQSQIDRCFAEMRGTVGKIPGLLSMRHGVFQSDEGLTDGFTHGFVMPFASPFVFSISSAHENAA